MAAVLPSVNPSLCATRLSFRVHALGQNGVGQSLGKVFME